MADVARQVLEATGRRRAVIGLPHWLAGAMGAVLDAGQAMTGGLVTNRILTQDQARTLRLPNCVGTGVRTLADLGITPTATSAVITEYLWRFRPSGQFEAITDSAKNLRNG